MLIIDDDEDILFTFRAIAEYANWDVQGLLDGFEGLKVAASWHPHLIIVDYHMPIINGEEFIIKLREFDSNTPVMVLTVDEDQKLAERLLKLGATDFALKPLRAPDFISRVNLHISAVQDPEEPLVVPKGISLATLNVIIRYLGRCTGFVTIENVAANCDVSYPSAHRYLSYLEEQGYLQRKEIYGEVGRPRRAYKWVK